MLGTPFFNRSNRTDRMTNDMRLTTDDIHEPKQVVSTKEEEEEEVDGQQPDFLCTDEICTPIVTTAPDAAVAVAAAEGLGAAHQADDSIVAAQNTDTKKRSNKKKNSKSSASAHIKQLHTQQELDSLIQQEETVIVEFVTTWCGACKSIQPLYDELAAAHTDAVLSAQVVCDKNKETKKLATAMGVRSYPVFFVYDTQGNESIRWNGADVGKLEKAFEKNSTDAGAGKQKKKKGNKKKR